MRSFIFRQITRQLILLLAFGFVAPSLLSTQKAQAAGEPLTVITMHPQLSSNDPSPEFRFVADTVGAQFMCSIDSGPAEACTSPYVTPVLDDGLHTFSVRAAAAGSNTYNPSPATFSWSYTYDSNAVIDINSCVELQNIGYDNSYASSSDYTLAHDIDCSDTVNWNEGAGWLPLATFGSKFSGTLDGAGFTINNLTMNRVPENALGFIRYAENATIQDLNINGSIYNSSTELSTCIGGLIGFASGAVTIDNVHSSVDIGSAIDDNSGGGIIGCASISSGQILIANSSVDADMTTGVSGGLISSYYSTGSASLVLTDNTVTGTIVSQSYTGGLVGAFYYQWDETTSSDALTVERNDVDMSIANGDYAGGLIGSLVTDHRAASIVDSSFRGNIDISSGREAGGLVARMEAGSYGASVTISQSFADADITTDSDIAGGLVGWTNGSQGLDIEKSYFAGTIDSTVGHVGGLVGSANGNTHIDDSYADVLLDGTAYIGGLVGIGTGVLINRSFAYGQIASTASVLGGLVGSLNDGTIADSFAAVRIAATMPTTVGGLVGAIAGALVDNGYTDTAIGNKGCAFTGSPDFPSTIDCTEISDPGYFFDNTTNAPLDTWNFGTIWKTNEQFYPCLQWQESCSSFEPQMLCEQPSATATTIHGACDIQPRPGFEYGTTTWEARYKKVGDADYQGVELDDDTIASATVTGLQPNEQYYLEFRFTNNWGTGQWGRIEIDTNDNPDFEIDMSSAEDESLIHFAMTGCGSLGPWQTQKEADLSAQDAAFAYPKGLVKFKLISCSVGGTATVRLTFTTDQDPASFVLRKFNENLGSFTTLNQADNDLVISGTTLQGKVAVQVVYTITDGGPLDQDGQANGEIQDPVGLASQLIGAPNTGLGGV